MIISARMNSFKPFSPPLCKRSSYIKQIKIFALFFIVFFVSGCGVDADQRNFEREALSPPAEITEMTAAGIRIEDTEADASDWRIAPEFRGLIEVQTPAYPNPVSFNGTLSIDFYISGVQAVNGLYVYVFRPRVTSLAGPFYVERQSLNPGLLTVTLAPSQFTKTGTEATNLYRIVVYDASNSIITYGDVKVK